jgi:hypothetical protein
LLAGNLITAASSRTMRLLKIGIRFQDSFFMAIHEPLNISETQIHY